jgi:hypothetical protein
MSTQLRFCTLAAVALMFTAQAQAAVDYGPKDTVTFISSCAANFEACRNEVMTISNYNQIRITGSAYPGCTFPHTTGGFHADSIVATNAIIDWLKANKAGLPPKTDDAVERAMKALWPNLCEH